ncbi:MAG: DUF2304 domain-containing protein [Faecalibacterium sp.]|jgi:hypothetical protein|nr:DUF2304 domain-containing protein [Faecalibacterium sp.]
MTLINQIWFIIMAVCLLLMVLLLLKKGVLTVKYSLLWLFCGFGLLIAALFPYLIYVIRDILDMVMPSNVVFLMMFGFVLLLLLSHSVAISQLSEKSKRQTQSLALLEKRVRALEEQLRAEKGPRD